MTELLHTSTDVAAACREALRDRLPRLDTHMQCLATRFYGSHSEYAFEAWNRAITWQWAYWPRSQVACERTRLASARGNVWVAIEYDGGFWPDASFEWRELTGEARLLAWTLNYEPVITQLRARLGVTLEPIEIACADAHSSQGDAHAMDSYSFTFTVHDTAKDLLLAGTVWMDADLARALNDQPSTAARCDLRTISSVPIACRVVIASFGLPLRQLRTLACGDVICLGSASRVSEGGRMRIESIDQRLSIRTRQTKGALRVEALEWSHTNNGRVSMALEAGVSNAVETSSTEEGAHNAQDIEALPVALTFEAGEMDLTIGALQALAPGTTLSLGRSLEDSPITVRANGRRFATGELVLIGDFLGVRIVERHSNGSE
jgi:type III secretion system YscQ/HrcQ family protein